jgi:hypothetical protein
MGRFIVLDDTGFGQLGCYGSPINTPNLNALAADGLRSSNMHTTALCSPSRSCMITGRNHHSNGLACITEGSMGYPGSNGYIPFENGFLSEILLEKGYNTYAMGKWHLTPAEATSAAGPYDRWPLGRGFERYYGFLGGDTHQYYPELVSDNHQVEPEKTPEEGYHLTPDLVEKAKAMIADSKQVAPDKPFFMYFCTGGLHAPHHVPRERADKYKGKFDGGWDVYREQVFKRQKELAMRPRASSTCPIRYRCTSTFQKEARKGCCFRWAATMAGFHSTSRTAGLPMVTTMSLISASKWCRATRYRKAITYSALSSPRLASPTLPRARAVPANIKLFVDAQQIGNGDLPVTIPLSLGLAAGVSIGADSGSPVMEDYKPPFAFTGTVKKALM